MQSFIVLGIIPGTDIQTNFNFWIIIGLLLGVVAFRMHLVAAHERLQAYIIVRKMARVIDHCDFTTIAN